MLLGVGLEGKALGCVECNVFEHLGNIAFRLLFIGYLIV